MLRTIPIFRCAAVVAISLVAAASVSAQDVTFFSAKAPVADIALFDGNVLVGQYLKADGTPYANAKVSFYQNGKLVKASETNEQGHFVARSLPAGMYEIKSQNAAGLYRLWAPNTAPPAAKNGVLMVGNQGIMRGQDPNAPLLPIIAAGASITFSTIYLATEVADGAS